MRVQVQIPGTVESYCVDERGNKLEATEEHWLETYLCSVLRAYSYADNGSGDTIKRIIGVRRFNPISSTEQEQRFLDAAEKLFFNGWQLGSDPEIQVPNLVSNHLTSGLLHYIRITGRFASGINLFQKLREKDPEISSLLARVYIAGDEEVKAITLLHEAIEELPMDYSLLDCQAEFCNRKGRSELALEIAKRGVVSAPSEFGTWARLAEIYVAQENWELALLTLNSCPMFTYQDKDAPRLPEPSRISLPLAPETLCDEIDDAGATPGDQEVHPTLRRLAAGNYKGTFHKAYMLLTEITKKIGWDQLLKIRSQVFVMEEEY
ncbi:bud site selection protein, partial [Oleoguttula sp. CCFEE 5521]